MNYSTRPGLALIVKDEGADSTYISTADLLALVLTNKKAQTIIEELGHNMQTVIEHAQAHTLSDIAGITTTDESTLLAAVEIGNRYNRSTHYKELMNQPEALVKYLSYLRQEKQEVFVVIALDTKLRLITSKEVFRGRLDACIVHPREVFNFAIGCHAATIVIAHNHPSGSVLPSNEDKAFTKKIAECSRIMGINLLDSLIIGSGESYFSFMESNPECFEVS